jgi:hypothetical protein
MGVGYAHKKKPGTRDMYYSFGGYGCDPELDPDIFVTLPKQVQQEKLAIREITKTTNAVGFHTIDPSTGQPYPDQSPLIMDIAMQQYPHLFDPEFVMPEEPVDVPEDVPLRVLKKFGLNAVRKC